MYATLTYLVDKLKIKSSTQTNQKAAEVQKQPRLQRSLNVIKDSHPTIPTEESVEFLTPKISSPQSKRQQSAYHAASNRNKLNINLADKVDPQKFNHPMQVGFIDAYKFFDFEEEDFDDSRTIGESSVNELMLEDEMDKKER